jgi:hypothetical protein
MLHPVSTLTRKDVLLRLLLHNIIYILNLNVRALVYATVELSFLYVDVHSNGRDSDRIGNKSRDS